METSAKDSLKPDPTTARTMKFAALHYTVAKIASPWKLVKTRYADFSKKNQMS